MDNPTDTYSGVVVQQSRTLIVIGDINEETTATICAALLSLSSESDEPILLYLNSPGGGVAEAFSIITIIETISAPVWTICLGEVSSSATLVFMAGETGHRYISEYATVALHGLQVRAPGGYIDATENAIEAQQSQAVQERIAAFVAAHSSIKSEDAHKIISRTLYLDASQAITHKIADTLFSTPFFA